MISVCMTTYNGEKHIKEQVDSILSQLSENDEIIVSDDGSQDATLSILQLFNDKRIKIFSHTKKPIAKNIFKFDLTTRNMENALNNANGDFIIMVDQDDIWLDGRVRSAMSSLNYYSLVVNDCIVINENKEMIYDSYFKLIAAGKGFFKNFKKNTYLGCCMAFKKEILINALPFPKKPIPHDIWIGMVSEIYGKVYFSNDKKILYRRHGNNLSNSAEISNNNFFFKIRYRLLILEAVLLMYFRSKK